jgi:hypothetical protein
MSDGVPKADEEVQLRQRLLDRCTAGLERRHEVEAEATEVTAERCWLRVLDIELPTLCEKPAASRPPDAGSQR